MVMISGCASKEGTLKFSNKFNDNSQNNFQRFADLTLSNVGLGTYLGDPDERTDLLVVNAVKNSIFSGINVIDTAINYRGQRSERSIGKALTELVEEGKTNRDEIFVCTKNGYITNDAEIQGDFWQYINKEYVQKGIINAGDISSGYHCMTIPYLEDQIERSLKNLNLDCIDLMYLHNPVEGQIQDIERDEFKKRLKSVFELYEKKRQEGKIKYYGLATWECFRTEKENPMYFSLKEIIEVAKDVGGDDHGFRFVQLPFNMYFDQAYMKKNQPVNNTLVSFLEAAKEFGIGVFTSVPFMQGRLLAPGVMPEFGNLSPPLRALQFIRSTPGVLAPLVGQKSQEHLEENLKIMNIDPMNENQFRDLVKELTS